MTITSSPPIRTSSIVTTVSSGLKVRLASLYGSVMRSTSCTPSSSSISSLSTLCPARPTPSTVRVTPGRPVHVHAQLDEAGDDRLDLRLGGPFFHDDDHDSTPPLLRICTPLSRSRLVLAVHGAAFGAPRFVDDPLEQPDDRFGRRAGPPARSPTAGRWRAPAPRDPADRSAARPPASAGRLRTAHADAHVQQPHQLFVDDVDAARADRRCVRTSATAHTPRPVCRDRRRRAGLGDRRDQRAADHRGVGLGADFARRAPASRCRSRARPAASLTRANPPHHLLRRRRRPGRGRRSRPAARSRRESRCRAPPPSADPRVGRRRTEQEDCINPARRQQCRGSRRPPRSAGRAPARRRRRPPRARSANALGAQPQDRVGVAEDDDRRRDVGPDAARPASSDAAQRRRRPPAPARWRAG